MLSRRHVVQPISRFGQLEKVRTVESFVEPLEQSADTY
jgi:hypothetical protein